MKLSSLEHAQMLLERKQYKKLLTGIINQDHLPDFEGLEITCIGNGGGSDASVQGFPTGGFLLRYENRSLIVDPGENSLANLVRLGFNPYSITDVLASHPHNDHTGNLTSVASAALNHNLNHHESDSHFVVSPSLVDYTNQNNTKYGFTLPAFAWEGHVDILYPDVVEVTRFDGIKEKSKKTVQISKNISVSATKARHANLLVTGFIIDTPLGRLGYTSDTEYYSELNEEYANVDVLWMNLNTLSLNSMVDVAVDLDESSSVRDHLGYVGVCNLIENISPGTAVISHFGTQLLNQTSTIQDMLRARFSDQGSPISIYCADTGDAFRYNKHLRENPSVSQFSK